MSTTGKKNAWIGKAACNLTTALCDAMGIKGDENLAGKGLEIERLLTKFGETIMQQTLMEMEGKQQKLPAYK